MKIPSITVDSVRFFKFDQSDGAAFGPNKSRRRSDRSKHVTSYVELDEDFMLDW